MLRSMTGFGSAAAAIDGVEYAVEARSVNNRYFKSVVKLPECFAAAETEVDRRVRSRVQRGTVTLTVRMRVSDDKAAYDVNVEALTRYLDQLRPLEIEANPMLRVDIGALLQLPGVCEPPSYEELVAGTSDRLMKLIDEAIDALVSMREREGGEIGRDLQSNCDEIDRRLQVVGDTAWQVVQSYQQRLADRVADLTAGATVQIDEEHLAREVAVFAERCDVAEEVQRLGAHVAEFRRVMDGPDPAGRKLDFIAQEMLREANTIASKTPDADTARAVVEIKTAIDRIKEQVQNVE